VTPLAKLPGRIALAPTPWLVESLAARIEAGSWREARRAGRRVGRIWYEALPIRRGVVTSALEATFPGWHPTRVRTTARQVFESCAAGVTGLLWATAPRRRAGEILEHVTFEGLERHAEARRDGALIVTAHTEGWDLAAVAAAARGEPLAVLTRHLAHGPLDRMWQERRRRAGIRLVDGSAGLAAISGHLGPGRSLALVVDQRTQRREGGMLLPFLGRPAWTTTLPAALALRRSVPLLPVLSEPSGSEDILVRVLPAVAPCEGATARDRIRGTTLAINRIVEQRILRHPGSWMWLHRRWR